MLDQENICLSVEKKQREYKSVAPEIVQTSSFQFDDFQHYVDVNMNKKSAYTYTRGGENPTLTILEEKLAQLVDKEIFSLIEKVLEYQSELSAIEMEEVFTEGFSLAVSLLLEAISKE